MTKTRTITKQDLKTKFHRECADMIAPYGFSPSHYDSNGHLIFNHFLDEVGTISIASSPTNFGNAKNGLMQDVRRVLRAAGIDLNEPGKSSVPEIVDPKQLKRPELPTRRSDEANPTLVLVYNVMAERPGHRWLMEELVAATAPGLEESIARSRLNQRLSALRKAGSIQQERDDSRRTKKLGPPPLVYWLTPVDDPVGVTVSEPPPEDAKAKLDHIEELLTTGPPALDADFDNITAEELDLVAVIREYADRRANRTANNRVAELDSENRELKGRVAELEGQLATIRQALGG